jgi:hypothetical protein
MNRLFRNPKKAVYMIVAFVILLLMLFSISSRGHASELYLDGGMTVARGLAPSLGLSIKWPEKGPVNTDYELGFRLTGESEYKGSQPNAVTIYGMLVDGYGPLEAGIGFARTNVSWSYACQDTFELMLGLKWKRTRVRYQHNSSAGSCEPNTGRDWLMFSWRF